MQKSTISHHSSAQAKHKMSNPDWLHRQFSLTAVPAANAKMLMPSRHTLHLISAELCVFELGGELGGLGGELGREPKRG
jgi:hypothetical protein